DHGCGSGATLLYLLARGYTGIHGVDVGGACAGWNTLLAAEYGIEQPRFFVYDGKRLPLGDESIDLVFSQEVLEHVAPDVIDSYYGEEARVLRPGGIAFHQVPHRLAPYDSHTGTWLLHYLPRPAYLAIHRRFGEKADFVENQLFLRWPWVHRRAMRRHFGGCSDLTLDRLQALDRLDYYDGPAGLRRFVGQAVRTPVIGVPAGFLLKNLVMLDTLSVKGRRNPRSDAK
ncbi:MAG: class I SAM-dependent methyltransferase, partial [Pseudomonadota bacterium]